MELNVVQMRPLSGIGCSPALDLSCLPWAASSRIVLYSGAFKVDQSKDLYQQRR